MVTGVPGQGGQFQSVFPLIKPVCQLPWSASHLPSNGDSHTFRNHSSIPLARSPGDVTSLCLLFPVCEIIMVFISQVPPGLNKVLYRDVAHHLVRSVCSGANSCGDVKGFAGLLPFLSPLRPRNSPWAPASTVSKWGGSSLASRQSPEHC